MQPFDESGKPAAEAWLADLFSSFDALSVYSLFEGTALDVSSPPAQSVLADAEALLHAAFPLARHAAAAAAAGGGVAGAAGAPGGASASEGLLLQPAGTPTGGDVAAELYAAKASLFVYYACMRAELLRLEAGGEDGAEAAARFLDDALAQRALLLVAVELAANVLDRRRGTGAETIMPIGVTTAAPRGSAAASAAAAAMPPPDGYALFRAASLLLGALREPLAGGLAPPAPLYVAAHLGALLRWLINAPTWHVPSSLFAAIGGCHHRQQQVQQQQQHDGPPGRGTAADQSLAGFLRAAAQHAAELASAAVAALVPADWSSPSSAAEAAAAGGGRGVLALPPGLSRREYEAKVVAAVDSVLMTRLDLVFGRSLAEVVVCCAYGVLRALGAEPSFRVVIASLPSHLLVSAPPVRVVGATVAAAHGPPTTLTSGDVRSWYNTRFLPAVQGVLLQAAGAAPGPNNPDAAAEHGASAKGGYYDSPVKAVAIAAFSGSGGAGGNRHHLRPQQQQQDLGKGHSHALGGMAGAVGAAQVGTAAAHAAAVAAATVAGSSSAGAARRGRGNGGGGGGGVLKQRATNRNVLSSMR